MREKQQNKNHSLMCKQLFKGIMVSFVWSFAANAAGKIKRFEKEAILNCETYMTKKNRLVGL